MSTTRPGRPSEARATSGAATLAAATTGAATTGAATTGAATTTRGAGVSDDEGSVMLLVLGLTVVLVGLLVLVVDVSVLLLAQRGVASAADGAAVAAAQGLDEDVLRREGLGGVVPLGEAEVQRAVSSYASQVRPATSLAATREQDGVTVVVRAERVVHLPFGGWVGRETVTVRSVARARSPVAP